MFDNGTFDGERHAATLCRNGGYILDALFGEGFQHTPGYHIVDDTLVRCDILGLHLRDEQSMVVGNPRIIHAPAGQCAHCRRVLAEHGMIFQRRQQGRYFGKHVFGDMAASGSGIRDALLLIELLRDGQGLLRRESVSGVRFFLKGGQVEQERGFLYGFLALDTRDDKLPARFHNVVGCFGSLLVFPFFSGRELHDSIIRSTIRGQMNLKHGFGNKAFVFEVACAYHRQCRGLHTSE